MLPGKLFYRDFFHWFNILIFTSLGYLHYRFTLPAHSGKIKQNHAKLVFLFLCSCFSVFLLLFFCVYPFLIFHPRLHPFSNWFPSTLGRRAGLSNSSSWGRSPMNYFFWCWLQINCLSFHLRVLVSNTFIFLYMREFGYYTCSLFRPWRDEGNHYGIYDSFCLRPLFK